jgi:wyosine [tRNA(Phe)-imidazoG37] synthetase (radical SAM superfamily)
MIPFGPIPSRRLGHSLGINNLPRPKRCSSSCVYCQVGPTPQTQARRQRFHAPERVASEVGERVAELRRRGEPIDYLSFVPDGEPTLDLHLGDAIEMLRPLGIPIAVLTNASLIHLPQVRDELARADLVSVKVDAVREPAWRRVDRPDPDVDLQQMLEGLRVFARRFGGKLLSETMLVEGLNDAEEDLEATAGFLAGLAPRTAYLAVPTRPAAEAWCRPASEEAVGRAYELFRRVLPSVECLTGFGEADFGLAGDPGRELLGVLAIHPMREIEVEGFLAKAGADPSLLQDLVRERAVRPVEYRGQRFYVRRRAAGPSAAAQR